MKPFVIILILVSAGFNLSSQNTFDSFHYQGHLSAGNNNLYDKQVEVYFTLYKGVDKDEQVYSETQDVQISDNGYFSSNVGTGNSSLSSTYLYLNEVSWDENASYYLEVIINSIRIEFVRIMSVPFAMVSQKTLQKYALSELTDVDTSGIKENDVLKWDGDLWVPSPDLYYDTIPFADTAFYSIYSGVSKYSDTASVSLTSKDAWLKTGNSGTDPLNNYVGTVDNSDLHFITNGSRRLTILKDGRIGFGTTSPLSDLHLEGDNGFLFEGLHGAGSIPIEGEGTRLMWYSAKSAFRAGTLTSTRSTYWDDSKTGNYSFSVGKDNLAQGDFSASFGELSQSFGSHSMAIGYASVTKASAPYSFAAGHSSQTSGQYSVALGRGNKAIGEASMALGYHTTVRGDYSQAFGFYSEANGNNSTAFGYKAISNNNGSFIFADNSDNNSTSTNVDNQFLVRAAGGTVFYTSSNLSSGVELTPGSGSWSNLSDSLSKKNIIKINDDEILRKIEKINVYEWSYKTEKGIRHIGPMSQSFHKIFGYGSDERHITSVDIDGVNLSGIKALYEKSLRIDSQIDDYKLLLEKYKALQKEKELLEERLIRIEDKLKLDKE